jgi:hypothetical protein
MPTWTEIRNNLNGDHLNLLDYKGLEAAEQGRVRRTASGRDMRETRTAGGFRYEPWSMARPRRFGLVNHPEKGEAYQLTEAGEEALKVWRDSRATTTQEGTQH